MTAKQRVGLLEIIEVAESFGIPLSRCCEILDLHRQAVYRWRSGETHSNQHGGGGGHNKTRPEEEQRVVEIARQFPDYRCRRLSYALERGGVIHIGKTRVAEILKEHGLNHEFIRGYKKDVIPAADFLMYEPWRKNLVWGMDWTWVNVEDHFMYLIVLLDWYSRKILSWGLYKQVTSLEVVSVVTDAVAREEIDKLSPGAMRPRLVADHGSANASKHTRAQIEIQGLDLWLSGIGRPTGNARTERVIGTLKHEEIKLQESYDSQKQAMKNIAWMIDDYNERRPNQGNGGFAPSAVHASGRKLLADARQRARQKTEFERRMFWKGLQNQTTLL